MECINLFKYDLTEYRRQKKSLKTMTYSGFKKSQVLSSYIKEMKENHLLSACHRCVELHISQCIPSMIHKLICFVGKSINLSNPRLPEFLWKRITYLDKLVERYNENENIQSLRNVLCEITCVLTLSPKKPIETIFKLSNQDLRKENIMKHCRAPASWKCPIWHQDDPPFLENAVREFSWGVSQMYNQSMSAFEHSFFWLSVLFLIHKKTKQTQKVSIECRARIIPNIEIKHLTSYIWIIWLILLHESKVRVQNNSRYHLLQTHVTSLFHLFCHNFKLSYLSTRFSLVIQATKVLCQFKPLSYQTSVYFEYELTVKTILHINHLYYELNKAPMNQEDIPIEPFKVLIIEDDSGSFYEQKQRSELTIEKRKQLSPPPSIDWKVDSQKPISQSLPIQNNNSAPYFSLTKSIQPQSIITSKTKPAVVKPTVVKPAVVKPAVVKPTVVTSVQKPTHEKEFAPIKSSQYKTRKRSFSTNQYRDELLDYQRQTKHSHKLFRDIQYLLKQGQ